MTPRERLLTVLKGGIPDRVPVSPDFSNMIPARLTGKPFWDLYLYNDPPPYEAYIRAAHHFGIDSLMDGYFWLHFPEDANSSEPEWQRYIVHRTDDMLVTQFGYRESGKWNWKPTVDVFYRADSPSSGVKPAKLGLPEVPTRWEPVEGVKPVLPGPEELKRVKRLMGDQGLVGVWLTGTNPFRSEDDLFRYIDNPELHEQWAQERVAAVERRFRQIMALDEKPDFLCVGGSGTLIFQTVDIFRQLALPAVKRGIELATAHGFPTHVHSCGPETALVKIMAEETALTVIDPLEIPPMGDCDLAELKRRYGKNLTLKGNLHTTDVMLRGTPDDVMLAACQAMRDAGEGGRFILSTGDQCGRDTPDENLFALLRAVEEFGVYDPVTGRLPKLVGVAP